MRTVLVTGPGGAGRTTVAAATALAAARRGARTLLLTTEDIGDLSAPRWEPTPAPPPCHRRLWAARVDSGDALPRRTPRLPGARRHRPRPARRPRLDARGTHRTARQRTVRPAPRAAHRPRAATGTSSSSTCRPCGEALAAARPARTAAPLPAPPAARGNARPPARCARCSPSSPACPMPPQWLYETAARWDAELAAVQALIEDPDDLRTAGRRTGPGRHRRPCAPPAPDSPCTACASTRSSPTGCCPRGSADPWLAALAAQQQKAWRAGRGVGARATSRSARSAPGPGPARRRRPRPARPGGGLHGLRFR